MAKTLKRVVRKRRLDNWLNGLHQECMSDPVYRAGFESKAGDGNPHPFPQQISIERAQIACIPTSLTDAQRARLKELNELLEATPWCRWSRGFHHRWESELAWA